MQRMTTAIGGLLPLVCVLAGGPAFAHAFLRHATPAVGGTVTRAPAEVTIVFTEAVEPEFSHIVVTDASGHRVDTGSAHADGRGDRLAIGLRPLAPGRYQVRWQATAVDTHKTEGSFGFTVAP